MEIIYSDIETSANCAFDSLEIYDGRFNIYYTAIASKCICILVHQNLGFLNVRYYEILYFAGEYELIRK